MLLRPHFPYTLARSQFVAAALAILPVCASVQAKEPAKATDRLTAPIATIEQTGPGTHIYQLAMSKNDKLCQRMLKLFNDDLKKYGYEQYNQHEEFKAIPWRNARFYSQQDGRTNYQDVQGALFDVNNDGVQDFVVRWAASLSGVLIDRLYVLDREAANRADKLVNRELFESKNKINMRTYKLDSRFGKDTEAFGIIEPFVFDGQVYIYMRPLFELAPKSKPTFSVIARYGGEQIDITDRSGKMDDLCYFKRIRKNKQPTG